jgi:hypothetical protein
MQVRIASRRVLVTLGAAGGFIGTAFAASRVVGGISLIDAALAEPFSILLGLMSGGLAGFSLWALLHPRCISRLAIVLVAVNCCTWLLCLASPTNIGPALAYSHTLIRRCLATRSHQ